MGFLIHRYIQYKAVLVCSQAVRIITAHFGIFRRKQYLDLKQFFIVAFKSEVLRKLILYCFHQDNWKFGKLLSVKQMKMQNTAVLSITDVLPGFVSQSKSLDLEKNHHSPIAQPLVSSQTCPARSQLSHHTCTQVSFPAAPPASLSKWCF